jgi:N-sulfoglucosamine sulfohydrolase
MKILTILIGLLAAVHAAERPNILWITSEDNAWNWIGCYGNADAVTPRIDALAENGVLFSHAYSNAPVCAVARSTILNGTYAVTQGTQHMRSRHPIPADIKPYVSYLREQGYYCTNNSKTDYNFLGKDGSIWDACSGKAHYKNRPEGKPFFAIFNLTVSHESSLFPNTIKKNRRRGIIPKTPRISPADVKLPPYLPDLPEIRSDIAIYHDNITALDRQVGAILDKLEKAGLADDTLIFYYGDHGGITPRGKRYLEDTGTRIPLIIHVPEKWKALSPFKPGQKVDETVAFVDLAPTVLSLIDIEKPAYMQGRAFLGPKRAEPAKDDVVFLFADRFDEIYGMRRGITDGRWKYIRTFTPHLPAAPYSYYQFGQAGWTAWKKAWEDGKLEKPYAEIWETPQPVERLFDTASDPMEVHNLAGDPAQAGKLAAMRRRLESKMIETADTGIIPEPMFPELSPGQPIMRYAASRKTAWPELVSLAFTASSGDPKNLALLVSKLSSKDPVTRYWAATGCLILGKEAQTAAGDLVKRLDDSQAAVRVVAAHALFVIGREETGKSALLAEMERPSNEYAQQLVINTLGQIDALDEIPDAWIERILQNPKAGKYLIRLAKILKKQRG